MNRRSMQNNELMFNNWFAKYWENAFWILLKIARAFIWWANREWFYWNRYVDLFP